MDFDWQGMLDFVVDCERQQSINKNAFDTFPLPDAVTSTIDTILPDTDQAILNLDTLEDDILGSYSSEAVENTIQELFPPTPEYCDTPYDLNDYICRAVPMPNEAVIYGTSDSLPLPPVPEQPAMATTFTFPIKIEVLGYVDPVPQPELLKQRQPPKPKKLKTFSSKWNCEQCTRSFKSKGGLVQHNQQIHSGPTPHGCDICGKRFRDFAAMQQHRQRHLMQDKPYKCDECPKQFIRHSDLQRHVNLHHRVSRHRCDICGKAFDRADHLQDHLLCHENGTVKKFKAK